MNNISHLLDLLEDHPDPNVQELILQVDGLISRLKRVDTDWQRYVSFLKKKYPPKPNVPWEFSCIHHQSVDNGLNQMLSRVGLIRFSDGFYV